MNILFMRPSRRLPATGLVAHYDFVQGADPLVLVDKGPNGHDGAFGATPDDPDWITEGVRFGGSGLITLPATISLRDAFTIIAVIKPSSLDDWPQAISKETPKQWCFGLSWNGDGNPFIEVSANGEDYVVRGTESGVLTLGEWACLCAAYEGATGTLDVYSGLTKANGALVGEVPTQLAESAGTPQIGYLYQGDFAYLVLYDRLLTASELTKAYRFIESRLSPRGITIS